MKRQYVKQIALSAGIALMVSMANAATLYWDADANPANNNVDGTGLGGAGSWSGTGLWWDGVSAANQNWVAGSDAVFAGTAGRIQLGANVSAGSLQFNTAGYIIDLAISNGGATHYTLSATGIGGSNGEILNSMSGGAHSTVTLNIASGTATWGGKINPNKANVTKAGAGTYKTTGQTGVTSAWGQPSLTVSAGTLQLVDNAGCNASGATIEVGGGTLDIGNNAMQARTITVRSGATLTSTGTGGSMTHNASFGAGSYFGTLSGALLVGYAANGIAPNIHPITGTANSFTGGTRLYSASAGTCDVRALADAALGTGRVRIENSVAGNTSWLRFQSALPTIGSLESANAGVKQVMLGCSGATLASATLKATWTSGQNTLTLTAVPWGAHFTSGLAVGQTITSATGNGIPAGATITEITGSATFKISANTTVTKSSGTNIGASPIDTTLSVGSLNQAADTFGGVISQASGTVGSLTKVGTGTWTLSGANTYTGTTRVENGKLTLTGSLGSGKMQVAGGTFEGGATGSRTVAFNLGSAPDGMVLTSGTLDVSTVNLSFTGVTDQKSYTLVDYSAGGTATFATNVDTANSFASATNIPEGYRMDHNSTTKLVTLQVIPLATLVIIR